MLGFLELRVSQHSHKMHFSNEYAEYPVSEIKKLYLCRTAYEKTLIQFEALKVENARLEAEIKKLNEILAKNLALIS